MSALRLETERLAIRSVPREDEARLVGDVLGDAAPASDLFLALEVQ